MLGKRGKRRLIGAAALCSMFNAALYADGTGAILDRLVEKGVLTAAEAQETRNESNELSVKNSKLQDEEIREMLRKERPKVKIGGYTQMVYTEDETAGGKNPVSIKRSRFAFSGSINGWTDYKIQWDFAAAGFREAWIDLVLDRELALFKVGQYHQPFGFENCCSSSRKKVSDTPQYMGKVLSGDYDYGAQIWGRLPGLLSDTLSWRFAVMNGTAGNTENNVYKDIAGRVVYSPVKGTEAGISAYNRFVNYTESGVTKFRNRTHYNCFLKVETETPFPVFFTAEYTGGSDSAGAKEVLDAVITLEARPPSNMGILSSVAPVFRYELWDPDISKREDDIRTVTAGLNFYADKSVRVLLDYAVKTEEPAVKNNKLNLMLQISY